ALGDLAEITAGLSRHQDYLSDDGDYLLNTGAMLNRDGVRVDSNSRFVRLPSERQDRYVLRAGDIVLSAMQPRIHVYREGDPPAAAGNGVIIIRGANNDYLASYLGTDDGRSLFEAQVERKG